MSIQVLVAGLPRLLSEVLSAGLSQSPDLVLTGVIDERARPGSCELDLAIKTHAPDAVVIGMNENETEAIERTRLRHCGLAILAVSPDGTHAWNLALRTEMQPVEGLSPPRLRAAIQSAVSTINETQRLHEPCQPQDLAQNPEGT